MLLCSYLASSNRVAVDRRGRFLWVQLLGPNKSVILARNRKLSGQVQSASPANQGSTAGLAPNVFSQRT